jgi:hypothetical protein
LFSWLLKRSRRLWWKLALEPKSILVQSLIDESKPGFLPVSDSIFSWWFGHVGDSHILEEPVTCISKV